MADVVILGAPMPERDEILCVFSDGSLAMLDADYGFYPVRPIDYAKAAVLPEGHGELIDKAEAYDRIMEQEGGNYIDMDSVGMGLEECQIVVPAEGGRRGWMN